MDIKAILFDFDGVLVDSEKVISKISLEVFNDLGIYPKEEDFLPFIGGGDKIFIESIAKLYNTEIDFESTIKKIHDKYYESEIPLINGALDFLARSKNAGFKIAIVSSAKRKKVLKNLKALNLGEDYFDLVVTGDNIVRNKPYGDIYQYAALNLKVPYNNCLVVEDSLLGVRAAKEAQCKVIALSTSHPFEDLEKAGAMFVFDDFTSIDKFESKEELIDFLEECTRDDRVKYGAVKCFEKEYPFSKEVLIDNAIKLAYKARKNAYTPYSHYNVGAAIVSASTNNIYSGCNVENASFGGTICAERGAVMNLISKEGPTGIKLVVVVTKDNPPAPPCALCLQVFSEFCNENTEFHLVDEEYAKDKTQGSHMVYKFKELLPIPFVLD
ncbi:MAG: cytidine deaminase [Sphaerochaetaceae bacterium]|nr:cytidine deaminase [Sphaerochaetaceae bacterium]